MKGRLLTAFLFAFFLFLGIRQFGVTEPPAVPPTLSVATQQRECALPAVKTKIAEDTVAAPARTDLQEHISCAPVLICSHNGTPLLSQSYYRTAYQAFHFSDSAG